MIKNKRNILLSLMLSVFSIVYIFIVKYVDVDSIGPKGSSVGLSSINKSFHSLTGYNSSLYKITEILGFIVLIVVGIYGLVGLIQLIKRKSLFKVDRKIIILGVFYVVVLAFYLLFEKVIINYRPVILDGVLEASFPSSHTMLSICVCMSAIYVNKDYIKNKSYLNIVNSFLFILMLLVIFGRLISGVHWLSDIVGGLIISSMLLSYFYTLVDWE